MWLKVSYFAIFYYVILSIVVRVELDLQTYEYMTNKRCLINLCDIKLEMENLVFSVKSLIFYYRKITCIFFKKNILIFGNWHGHVDGINW